MLHACRTRYREYQSLLREADELRLLQEDCVATSDISTTPITTTSSSSISFLRRIFLYWFGDWTREEATKLWFEFYYGVPRTALFAALAVTSACLLSLAKTFAQGALLDAFASAATVAAGKNDTVAVRDAAIRAGAIALITFALASLGEWIALVAKDILIARARAERAVTSRSTLFASLIRQDAAFHSTFAPAALAARLETDPAAFDELCVHGPERLAQGLVALCTLVVLASTDPALLALALLLRLPQLAQVTEASVRLAAAVERLGTAALVTAQTAAADSLSSVRLIQAYSAQSGETQRYDAALSDYARVASSGSLAMTLLRRSEGIALLFTELVLAAFGGARILAGHSSLGSFTARRAYFNAGVREGKWFPQACGSIYSHGSRHLSC